MPVEKKFLSVMAACPSGGGYYGSNEKQMVAVVVLPGPVVQLEAWYASDGINSGG